MKQYLSDRINAMEVSATLGMAAKTRELKAEGKDIIGLSLGEPDFDIPDFIKEAAIEAIQQNYSKYTPIDGYLELREAICEKFKRDNNLNYKPSQIVVSTGAKQCLANVALAMLNPGDEVIFPAPYWVSYKEIAKMAGGVPIEVHTTIENNFKITPAQLEAAITSKTKMVWFNTPCNPSGSIYSKAELEALAVVLRKYPHIFILSDEIYEYINFTNERVTSVAEIDSLYERTITVNGMSKAFAMTGWRIGYMGAPEWISKACAKVQGQVTSGTNAIAQRASIAALKAPKSKIQYMVDEFKRRRDLVLQLLNEIEGFKLNIPEGAFYVFPDISSFFGKTLRGRVINNATDFSLYLLEEAMVATVTGEAFGDANCIRFSYAASEKDLREAIRRIKESLQ
ncbi:pyridoxal phosphate-dependent aminotransferase [Capnocytophaga sputigena]|jgi:aspartate transaminase|uniref:Aminotransferase n=1 Tax=Capnocytophaga sputigena TaxID=1019 RepID=A0A2A3N3L1_CAPSP|nr:pyridoxal phosphate-dependent aminotransferase [Capnocytophaga sputigena]ATA69550.1 pyridoxal phosphate-dependent aminotransferase [Capnocytophaga sputigena]ATA78409.1 pyridoxal phosphate-dependent aminotransferase [Capnocytophaga sputigena]ATA83243.1 pyridoxal phosphate-dependent aminotransferase [Capnocytophaga sputigena]EEB66064.1 aminotransferase, class I/II [Capnocytophaga sputigena ATCC 33612]PBN46218.1 pyridoxal phosphate-dependent aminotransferase [Capnocytophaga sputigena]